MSGASKRLHVAVAPWLIALYACLSPMPPMGHPSIPSIPSISTAPSVPIVTASCAAPAHLTGGSQYSGTTEPSGAILVALVENGTGSAAGTFDSYSVKIRWRLSGHGSPRIVAQGPQGRELYPDQGVLPHGRSDFAIPGTDEWGTFWRLPVTGCWVFSVYRDDMSGHLALDVK